jgi:hypothetical protein
MKPAKAVVEAVIAAAEAEGEFGVPGYVRFTYLKQTSSEVIVRRRNGNEARIPKATLAAALEGVRAKHALYIAGPDALREVGITHVNSPVFALLRLLPLNKLIE